MKDIVIKSRETLILSPGERYSMPDNIADQLIRRGRANPILADAKLPDRVEKPAKKGGK